jgi:hypothetical protein
MARLIEPRDIREVTVVVRHRCPTFAFGSALGPHQLVSWWSANMETGCTEVIEDHRSMAADRKAIEAAILVQLEGLHDYRRHLDELAELP